MIQAYKEHAAFLLSRRNTVSGVTYGNDPTIFSWNLINEGRCETANCTAADIQVCPARPGPVQEDLLSAAPALQPATLVQGQCGA